MIIYTCLLSNETVTRFFSANFSVEIRKCIPSSYHAKGPRRSQILERLWRMGSKLKQCKGSWPSNNDFPFFPTFTNLSTLVSRISRKHQHSSSRLVSSWLPTAFTDYVCNTISTVFFQLLSTVFQ